MNSRTVDRPPSVLRTGRKPNSHTRAALAPSAHGVTAGDPAPFWFKTMLGRRHAPNIHKRRQSRESVMTAADPTPQLDIPNEMRVVAKRSVEQAKSAFTGYMRAAEEAVSTFEDRVKASPTCSRGQPMSNEDDRPQGSAPRLSRGSSAPTDCVAVCGSRSAGSLLFRLRCAADRARQACASRRKRGQR